MSHQSKTEVVSLNHGLLHDDTVKGSAKSNLMLGEKLLPRYSCNLHQIQLVRPGRQRSKREIRLLIQLEELANHLLDQIDSSVRAHAVPPPELARIPPPGRAIRGLVDEAVAVPNGSDIVLATGRAVIGADGQVEILGAIVHDVVDAYENRSAQLNGLQRIIKCADGQRPAANPSRFLKDGDVDFDICFICILSQMVRSRRPGSSSSCGIWLVPGCLLCHLSYRRSVCKPHSQSRGLSVQRNQPQSMSTHQ